MCQKILQKCFISDSILVKNMHFIKSQKCLKTAPSTSAKELQSGIGQNSGITTDKMLVFPIYIYTCIFKTINY